jgi:hypothetical protein
MSSDKNESESTLNGPVLVNGMEEVGRESPGVGVSGNKPMVNGDLRDVGDGGETDFVAVKTPLDGINNSTHEDAAVKQSSSVSMIVSGGSAKTVIGSTSKPRLSSYYSRPQQHRLPPLSYYRYVVPTNHQPTPLFYSPHPQVSSLLVLNEHIKFSRGFTLPLSCVVWCSVVLYWRDLSPCQLSSLVYSSAGRTLSLSAECSGFEYSGKAFYNLSFPLLTYVQTYLGSGGMQGGGSQLSNTNLYIRGLSEKCCDDDLTRMCQQYGKIVSTKAILDKETNCCKGYGFVDFENPADAMRAVHSLTAAGVMAQFAKVPQQQEQDPTNLYFSNLPKTFDEKELEGLVSPYGTIISTRILRDQNNTSRGVGFVRLDTKESCDKTIEMLNGSTLQDSSEPLMVKFADSSSNKKRQFVTGRWRDIEYMYDGSHMLAQNGLVGSRVVHQGMLTSQYLQTPATHQVPGYQVPVSQTMSTGAWQPTYYVQPSTQAALGTSSGMEGVASNISSHLNHLHISTSSPYNTATPHQPAGYTAAHTTGAAYQLAPHTAPVTPYAQQTGAGWTFSHHLPQQEHVSEVHNGNSEGKGHIQVIATADHTPSLGKDDQHSIHLYYPNNWVGK